MFTIKRSTWAREKNLSWFRNFVNTEVIGGGGGKDGIIHSKQITRWSPRLIIWVTLHCLLTTLCHQWDLMELQLFIWKPQGGHTVFFVQIIHWWKFSSSLLERPHFNQRIARFKVLVHRQCTMQYVGHTPGITIRSTPALASHIVSSPSPEAKDRAQHQS